MNIPAAAPLQLGVGLSAGLWGASGARAQTPASQVKAIDIPAPDFHLEKGAKLRMLRPVKFVQPDEDIFRANAKRFADKTGVEMKVDFVGWEDINQQTAVTSNSGAGPDLIMGFSDAPHIYIDKLIELTDVADYLGKKYGGWGDGGEVRQEARDQHLDRHPVRRELRSADLPQVDPAAGGYDKVPDDMAACSSCCKKLKAAGKPAGFALGNAVGDGNGFANWILWSHGASLLDEKGDVIINSKETDRGAEVSQGALSDLHSGHDVVERRLQQPRLFGRRNLADGERRVALLLAEERPGDQGDRRRHRAPAAAEGPGTDPADGRADAERHGVQALQVPERGEGVPALHAGEGAVRTLAQRQQRLLVAAARRLRGRRGVVRRPEGRSCSRTR